MQSSNKLTRRSVLATGLASTLAGTSAFAQQTQISPEPSSNRKRLTRIAHLTDVHVFAERSADEGFAQCLQHVQSQDDAPDLIIFGGDNVMNVDGDGRDTAQEQLDVWNRVLKDECSLPYKIVIGNHDILANDPVDGKKWAIDAYGLENRYYAFDQAGWKMIVLDSTSPLETGGYKGRLDAEQMDWLKSTLAETSQDQPVCIVSHIPILCPSAYFDGSNEETGDWVVPGAWMHIDARAIKDLFYQHPNVRLSISGHIHLVDTATYLGVKYACNGAVCGGWWRGPNQEFNPGYALIDLYNDGTSEIHFTTYGWKAEG